MKKAKTAMKLLGTTSLGMGLVIVLFLSSERQVHRNNVFTRRYPHHPIKKLYDLPIGFDSYYIAGVDNDILFLGNTTAPLHLLRINIKTGDTSHINLNLPTRNLPFKAVTVQVYPPYFYVMDGTIPCIFKGILGDWNAKLWMKDKAYFTKAFPLDTSKIYINTINSDTRLATLGILEKRWDFRVSLHPEILEKQIDGMFDVDGTMVVSQDGKTLGFVYYYRNQFMVMDSMLGLLGRQETIDTVKIAHIELSRANKKGQVKMKAPPLKINHTAALYNDLMLINSPRLDKYEDPRMLDEAAIIDVYNWKERTYDFSFYLYRIEQKKLKEFRVYDKYLLALLGDMFSVYSLDEGQFNGTGQSATRNEKNNEIPAGSRMKTENL
ncbi:hypothetical protein [Flagellimonas sediminis]|uniref:DUF4221 domain-containing protein n=1 Tax=Flagellimonas sediminis TaxID=2696468 RepID=A0A6I5KQQ4_9FLAO|nr:hypothetical protein [Allomuricauda sediminis]NDV43096.1 hypothetical protein [Allomuricauda sediminis]